MRTLLVKQSALALLLLLAACEPETKNLSGYVEGEFLYLAPSSAGILENLAVERGQEVAVGDALFSLDLASLEAERDAARAGADKAKAQEADLAKGQRTPELEIIQNQQGQAKAALDVATKEFDRARAMIRTQTISQAALDERKATFESATARVAELDAQLQTAKLGGREDALAAAHAAVAEAAQKIVQADKQLNEAAPHAPFAGRIEDTYFHKGEYIPAGTPVVSLLPPENVKVRFFAPEALLPKLRPGQKIWISCDGCAEKIEAKITFIASQNEFTPPVIYSVGSRDKLVFMIEAKPLAFTPALRPGLPVDVSLSAP